MMATLRGTLLSKEAEKIILEAGGVGYEVSVTVPTAAGLALGESVLLHIVESFGMYGGGQTLYGFLTPSEKQLFLTFKDAIPSTGAKKALEYLEKASKSLPDFRRAVLDRDLSILSGVFGFSKKTAQRLIDSLKDKMEGVTVLGSEKISRLSGADIPTSSFSRALSALGALGYKPSEARAALQAVAEEFQSQKLEVEDILRLALKRL